MKKILIAHWRYAKYVFVHKYWVFRKGLITKAPIWRLVIHDWSKFTPAEWGPYVRHFYMDGGVSKHAKKGGSYDPADGSLAFNRAWVHHQHLNPHHWQHWVLREDSGATFALPMPEHYVREMVADWAGAGRAQGHGDDLLPWYLKNRDKMVLHDMTERRVLYWLTRLVMATTGPVRCQCGAPNSLPETCLFNGYCEAHHVGLASAGFSREEISKRHERLRKGTWTTTTPAEEVRLGLEPHMKRLHFTVVYNSQIYPDFDEATFNQLADEALLDLVGHFTREARGYLP